MKGSSSTQRMRGLRSMVIAETEKAPDHDGELPRVDGFGQVLVAPRLKDPLPVALHGERRDRENFDEPGLGGPP